ncbi:MAG: tmoC [Acidimicrobiia bacterium]|nr:tmoC [Acidimicrobiia bacterium]
MDWYDVCADDELRLGDMRSMVVDYCDVLITRTERGLGAVSNLCPHALQPLDTGTLEAGTITCSIHSWCFDVRTGTALRPAGARLSVYPVRVWQGRIQVRV